MVKIKSQQARSTNEPPRKKTKKNKKAMKRAKERKPSHSHPATAISQSETTTSNPSESLLRNSDEDNTHLEQNQVSHKSSKEEEERNKGKQHMANDTCLNSGGNPIESCTCEKINGYCVHSQIQINGRWFDVSNLTPVGNNGRRLQETFPRKEELIRPRLKDVISKIRREKNAATEEALAKSRGHRAHRSWKLKKVNAALARTLEEEEYESSREPASEDSNMYNISSSPSSRLETQPVENATMPEDSTPIPEHSESRRKKRKPKARLEGSQKRRKVASESSSAEEDINTAEEMIEAAHKDKNSQTEAHRAVVERADTMEELIEVLQVESTQPKPAPSPNSARRDSATDEAYNVQSIPYDDSHSPAKIDNGSK